MAAIYHFKLRRATPTLERMHFLSGVVNIVLVSVKVQCVKVVFVCEKQKRQLYHHQNRMCAQQSKLILCTSVFCEGQDRIPQN